MLRILSIGNSFSQDAQRYLYKIAKNEGVELKSMNLYIGSCSLKMHYDNMVSGEAKYSMELNGETSGQFYSIKQALLDDEWDYVTLQQVSHDSPYYETYQPYLSAVAEYVREHRPNAKLLIHQTWAYEQGCEMLQKLGYADQHEMYNGLERAYSQAASAIQAVGIIPSGKAMITAIDNGLGPIHRDTYHADLGVGRYMLGLVWYKSLTGKAAQNIFAEFDVEVEQERVLAVKHIAEQVAKQI